jgi:putative alpha-1,2-mannosidase
VKLEIGNTIEIDAANNSAANRYVEAMKMNGKSYDKNFLKYDDLQKGAKIEFNMSAQPNNKRGTADSSFPYSFSKEIAK